MNPSDFQDISVGKITHTITGHWAFVPAPLPPKITKWSTSLLNALSDADRNLSKLASIGDFLPNPHLFVRPFVRQEAILSSQIEGKISTLEDLYEYEAFQLSSREKYSDVREVHNYVRAMDFGLDKLKELPVSLRLIRNIHAKLMEGVRGEDQTPGEFRASQNFIGPPNSAIEDAIYVPPPVTEMHEALDHLEKYIHTLSDLPTLIRIALIHYQFEAIHPFRDGNGRIGRLLMVFQLCSWGLLQRPFLYISGYLEKNHREYYDCLLVISQKADWERWIIFFLKGVSKQSLEAVKRINHLRNIRSEYESLMGKGEMAKRLMEVVDMLLGYPIVTIRQVEKELNITYTKAQRHVKKLVDFGILQEITGHTRDRLYKADNILRAIKGPL